MNNALNFSTRPFASRSTAWYALASSCLLALLLALALLVHYFSLRHANQSLHARLAQLEKEDRQARQQAADALSFLETADLQTYRKDVEQIHDIETARAARWGALLDSLAALLNHDVRLIRLSSSELPASGNASLEFSLRAQARTKEAELQFVQALQAHQAFHNLRFEQESYPDSMGKRVEFDLRFHWRLPGEMP
jgi:hypothetical protein